jgi:hypothetical protein
MALVTTRKEVVDDNGDHLFSTGNSTDFVVCKAPEKLMKIVNAVKSGVTTFFLSDGYWSMHDLVLRLLQQFNPAELYITTYAIREQSIRAILLAKDDKLISNVNMLLDQRATVRTPEVYQLAKHNFAKVTLAAVHAKVTILKHPEGCVSIVGSSNWTNNPKLESGVVSTDEALGNWYIDNIKKMIDGSSIFKA